MTLVVLIRLLFSRPRVVLYNTRLGREKEILEKHKNDYNDQWNCVYREHVTILDSSRLEAHANNDC